MPVSFPHPFPMGYNESKSCFGSASAEPLLHHSKGAAVCVGKGMKESWRAWEDRPGGMGFPLVKTGLVSAVGDH